MSNGNGTSRIIGVRTLVATLAIALLVTPALSVDPAQGDEISDLQARAEQISNEMTDLQARIRASTSEVERTRYRSSRLDEQIAEKEKALAAARRDEASAREEVSAFALRAYVSGGSSTDLGSVLGTDGDKLGQRGEYQSLAVGDRQQLVDQLTAAERRTADQARRLEADRQQAADNQARAERSQREAEQAADELATIERRIDGELATLVAERQAARERADRERVRARLEAEQARARAEAEPDPEPRPTVTPEPVPAPEPSAPAPTVPQEPTPTSPPAVTAPPDASAASIAIAAARSQLGVPYSWGGGSANGPTYGIAQGANTIGFDCSGLTLYAYAQAGITLSHLTWDQMNQGRTVPLSQIRPGDLVFYFGGTHMGLYVGDGQVIHAPRTGDVVRYGSLYMGPPELVVRPTG